MRERVEVTARGRAEDHGLAPQALIVPLLYRRVVGVVVGVQDRALVRHRRRVALASDIGSETWRGAS